MFPTRKAITRYGMRVTGCVRNTGCQSSRRGRTGERNMRNGTLNAKAQVGKAAGTGKTDREIMRTVRTGAGSVLRAF